MDGKKPENRHLCPEEDIAAYLDGELDKIAEARLEKHLNECTECLKKINTQKFILNQLDKEFANFNEIDLPENFSNRIVAFAESRVSGLRSIGELRSAAIILLIFGSFAAFFLTSINLRGEIPAISIVEKILGAATLFLHLVYDLSVAMAAFTRALSRAWTVATIYAVIFVGLVLLSAFILKRLLRKDL